MGRSTYNIIIALLTFPKSIADRSLDPAQRDGSKQDSGYMSSFDLGFVFSPAYFGADDKSAKIWRSSTSSSDYFTQSVTISLEEAVATTRQVACIVHMLIDKWHAVVESLATLSPIRSCIP